MTPTLQRLIEWAGGVHWHRGCTWRDEVVDANVLVELLALGDVGEDKQWMAEREEMKTVSVSVPTYLYGYSFAEVKPG